MPDTLEGIFKVMAQSCAKASGSSFGTLLAVGFLTAAKSVGERSTMNRELMASILQAVVAALSYRGGAKLGDKTMLDSLEAIRKVLSAGEGQSDLQILACDAALDALDLLRNKPNRIGRASMFSERSVGMDDPGMVAVWRMTQNLAA
jgi:dihydroxyacetone kinase-like protein